MLSDSEKLETYYKAQKQDWFLELHFQGILLGFFKRISSTYIAMNFAEFILQKGMLSKRNGFQRTRMKQK